MTIVLEEAYAAYEQRVRSLEHLVLGPIKKVKSGVSLDYKELDNTKAYTILAYAESEHFVEYLANGVLEIIGSYLDALEAEIPNLETSGHKLNAGVLDRASGFLEKLDVKKGEQKNVEQLLQGKKLAKSFPLKHTLDVLRGRLRSRTSDIKANNGLNIADMSKLFDRAGFETEKKYSALRGRLELLTKQRSRFAHTGEIFFAEGVRELPDPGTQQELVKLISIDLADFTSEILKLRLR